MATKSQAKAPAHPDAPKGFELALYNFYDFVIFSCPPGPKFLHNGWVINLQKCLMPIYCVFLMVHFQNFSAPMVFYSVLHGTYGLIWLSKHLAMPDPAWN